MFKAVIIIWGIGGEGVLSGGLANIRVEVPIRGIVATQTKPEIPPSVEAETQEFYSPNPVEKEGFSIIKIDSRTPDPTPGSQKVLVWGRPPSAERGRTPVFF